MLVLRNSGEILLVEQGLDSSVLELGGGGVGLRTFRLQDIAHSLSIISLFS